MGVVLKDIGDRYSQSTTKGSDVNRQIDLAGLALIWIFKATDNRVPAELFLPGLLLVTALGLDLFQYLLAAATHFVYYLVYEKQKRGGVINDDTDITMPNWTIFSVDMVFFAKVILTCTAYFFLFSYIQDRIV
jgi:hypothetical protein